MRASEACHARGNSEGKRRAVKAKSRKRQLSVYEVSQIVVNKKFKSRLELFWHLHKNNKTKGRENRPHSIYSQPWI